MNLDPLSFALSQIAYAVANLTKKNYKHSVGEINKLVETHGNEAYCHLFRCLFAYIDLNSEAKNGGKDNHQIQLLIQEIHTLLDKPNLSSILCSAFDNPINNKELVVNNQLLTSLSKQLKLNPIQEITFNISLSHSLISDTKEIVRIFATTKIQKLESSNNILDEIKTTPAKTFQNLLLFLKDIEIKRNFINFLKNNLSKNIILHSLLTNEYSSDVPMPFRKMAQPIDDNYLADLILEHGYNFTSSVEICKSILQEFDPKILTATSVARVLGTMANSLDGLRSEVIGRNIDNQDCNTWQGVVFARTLQEVAPHLNFREVVAELDYPKFKVATVEGLKLIVQAITLSISFPVDLLFGLWSNKEGQLSILRLCVNHPKVLNLGDHSTKIVHLDILKNQPEDEVISVWKNIDLHETLIRLSDYCSNTKELFKYPVFHCPDVLTIALLQIPSWNNLKQDLMKQLFPIFLGHHVNSTPILQYAWNGNDGRAKDLLVICMQEYYARGDNQDQKLSRILDIAQDLKALSLLLNLEPTVFVIDLAFLAVRREYLNLGKWLSDKLNEHSEKLVILCVTFLKEKCPALLNSQEDARGKSMPISEKVVLMLELLADYVSRHKISPELKHTIETMNLNVSRLLSKFYPPPNQAGHTSPKLQAPISSVNLINSPIPQNTSSRNSLTSSQFDINNSIIGVRQSTTSTVPQQPIPMPTPQSPQVSNSTAAQSQQLPVNPPYAPDVEEEANSYFQKLYNHNMPDALTVEALLEKFKNFKISNDQRDKAVYSCMLRSLFDEYRFFHQYPEKELEITSELFGGIIKEGLVTYMNLGLALRYVLEALKKPSNGKMYYFGNRALNKFKSRLKDYPQYCHHLAALPHFNTLENNLKTYIEYGMRSQSPNQHTPNQPVISQPPSNSIDELSPPTFSQNILPPVSVPTSLASHPSLPAAPIPQTRDIAKAPTIGTVIQRPNPGASIANTTNIDTLLANQDKFAVPPESVQDKIAFIFNNLSKANLPEKCKELKDCISDEYVSWVAQYLVMKRVSIEPNFHSLYDKLNDHYNVSNFLNLVIKETMRNIKVLLTSDKSAANYSDRSLLKNLGHWVGLLTIGKNKPLLTSDIDLKSLLYEAYHRGSQELLYVVPFVAKVLESCSKSSIFAPPCPWTMGLINALAELHHEPDLKLNLKFEIEVLCNSLKIDIGDLKPKRYLRNPERLTKLEVQLSAHAQHSMPPPKDMASAIVAQIQNPSTPEATSLIPMSANTPMPSQTSVSTPQVSSASLPQFSYVEINLANGVMPLLNLTDNTQLLMQFPQVKNVIKPFIQTAVGELIKPGVDRSIKITLMTVEHIVKKDFAFESDEMRMRTAAQQMTRNMTAGMALITCREPLLVSLVDKLKTTINNILTKMNVNAGYLKEQVDITVNTISQEAIEACVAFIQKTAVEEALIEIDKRLAGEYEARKVARSEGRLYKDPAMMAYYADRMPDQMHLKLTASTSQLNIVYDEFGRYIPGFSTVGMPATPSMPMDIQSAQNRIVSNYPNVNSDELCSGFKRLFTKLDNVVGTAMTNISCHSLTNHLRSLLEKLYSASQPTNDASLPTMNVVGQAVEGYLDSYGSLSQTVESLRLEEFRKIHLMVLQSVYDFNQHTQQWTVKQVTRCLLEKRDDTVYNLEAIERLIKGKLVHMQQYDSFLGHLINEQCYIPVIPLAIGLCENLLLPPDKNGLLTPILSDSELFNTYTALERAVQNNSAAYSEKAAAVVEKIRLYQNEGSMIEKSGTTSSSTMMHSGIMQAKEIDDPQGLYEKAENLLREWVVMYHQPAAGRDSTKAFSNFVQHMHQQGILKTDDLITRFFRLCTEMSVYMTYKLIPENSQQNHVIPIAIKTKCFQRLDAFVRLIALLVKHSGDETNMVTKVNLLNKVLGIVAGVMLQDHEARETEFQQLPYHRIFIMLFMELNAPERILENINFQVLCAFFNVFHITRPSRAPGFAFAWLELISHRVFIGRMLALTPNHNGWPMYAQLLIDLFRYMAPFLRNADLKKSTLLLYRGSLRVLLIMLHDFPELLCDYHYAFCDVVPPNCIQMRNLILSAFPRNMRLPDPFTPNLKIEMLQEINHNPKCSVSYASAIQPASFKKELDSYLANRSPVQFLSDMRSILQQLCPELGTRYNMSLMNALVLYVGNQAISHIHGRNLSPNMTTIAHSAHMDIFQNLAVALDTEGRYIFLNAMANHLRFPNSHTHYFSCALLYLFAEANTEAIQEQITRVLLERLIVNRPHPWGLLITFIELIKNPTFNFWQHSFVHCAPEIEKLFESVAKSCSQQKQTHSIPQSITPPQQENNSGDSQHIIASA